MQKPKRADVYIEQIKTTDTKPTDTEKDSKESQKGLSKDELNKIAFLSTLEVAAETQPELVAKIEEFLEYRKAKKSPVLPASYSAWLKKLKTLSGGQSEEAIAILDESIANGWTGIFERDAKKQGAGTKVSSNQY